MPSNTIKQDLSNTVANSKYTRKGENFTDAVNRGRDMMINLYGHIPEMEEIIKDAYRYIERKEVLGSQRILQFGGDAIQKNNTRAFNCSGAYMDHPRRFAEILWILLAGCGSGVSLQKHHINKLPSFATKARFFLTTKEHKEDEIIKTFIIPDTIEGWADAVTVLMSPYFESPVDPKLSEYSSPHCDCVVFDYSQIRPKGSPLSSGGLAPGPDGLKAALEKCDSILKEVIVKQDKLSPINCLDILCHLSNAVLSGGVRRSSLLSLCSMDDMEMITAKTGKWWETHAHRGRVNVSVAFNKDKTSYEEYRAVMEHAKASGDPGIIFCEDFETIVNPCLVGDSRLLTPSGYKKIEDLVGDDVEIINWLGRAVKSKVWSNGEKECVEIQVGKNRTIKCTPDHRFMTVDGMTYQAGELTGKRLMPFTPRDMELNIGGKDTEMAILMKDSPLVTSVIPIGKHTVYDFTEPETHWGVVNGFVTHNCGEISFWCYTVKDQEKFDKFMSTYDGNGYTLANEEMGLESGISLCNLSMVNCSTVKTPEEFYERAEAASVIGTLQAGLTKKGYLGEASKKIVEKEALLGVSLSGMMEKPDIALSPECQRIAAQKVVAMNKKIAKMIGINPASRTTCIKPDGNSSCLLGCSPAIMPPHSRRYIRHMMVNPNEPIFQHFKEFNPQATAVSAWSAYKENPDHVLMFPIEISGEARIKQEVGPIDLLDAILLTKRNWIDYGKDESLCTQPWLTHNVSNTVTVPEGMWDEVIQYIFENRKDFCGVTLIGDTCELDLPQAPYTAVYTQEELEERYPCLRHQKVYEAVVKFKEDVLKVYDSIWTFASDFNLSMKTAYSIYAIEEETERDAMVASVEKATEKLGELRGLLIVIVNEHFDGNLTNTLHALKEIFNNNLYYSILSSWKKVDYTHLNYDATLDEKNNSAGATCAGGMCVLNRKL